MKPPKPPRRRNVTASSYDPETGHLTVTFHNGRRYRYEGVPQELAAEFGSHDSPGSFLRSHIIGKFDGAELFDDK